MKRYEIERITRKILNNEGRNPYCQDSNYNLVAKAIRNSDCSGNRKEVLANVVRTVRELELEE